MPREIATRVETLHSNVVGGMLQIGELLKFGSVRLELFSHLLLLLIDSVSVNFCSNCGMYICKKFLHAYFAMNGSPVFLTH